MALWKENTAAPGPTTSGTPAPSPTAASVTELHGKGDRPAAETAAATDAAKRPAPKPPGAESVIAAELAIEGKIVGGGDVRIAGRFKGDVQVDGNFRIDPGARLEGQVRAGLVVVGGELHGNVDAAKQVDVLASGVIVGDVKAASITVAAGARMRGHVEFGWGDEKPAALELKGTPRSV